MSISEIDAVTNNIDKLNENKVVACKQHAARTAVEQPADLAKVFMNIKKMLPTYTITNKRHPKKKLIIDAFKDQLAGFNLALNKRNALIDFLSKIPEIATKACTPDNIQHGFIEAGIIDKDKLRYPVLNKILATCRRNPTKVEYELILDTFEYFLNAAVENGHIPEEYLICMAFRLIGITTAKWLYVMQVYLKSICNVQSKFQVLLRNERLLQSQKKARQEKELENRKHQVKIDTNNEVVHMLCDLLEKEGMLAEGEIGTAKEEYLERCTLEMLIM